MMKLRIIFRGQEAVVEVIQGKEGQSIPLYNTVAFRAWTLLHIPTGIHVIVYHNGKVIDIGKTAQELGLKDMDIVEIVEFPTPTKS